MRSELELIVKFSKELDEKIFPVILNILKKNNFFVRANYSSNRLYVTLSGDRNLSETVFEIIKELSEFLREYRFGVRDFYVPSYEIRFPCEFIGKVKIPLAKVVICNGKFCHMVFRDLEKEFLRNNVVERAINLTKKKILRKTGRIIFENNAEIKKEKNNPEQKIAKLAKKGIIKKENIYLPEGAKRISEIKENIITNLKRDFEAEEIFVPFLTPLNIFENKDIAEAVPKEIFSKYISKPINLKQLYEIYYITGKIPKVETKNIGTFYNEIPLTLYKAFENTTANKQFFYYPNYLNLNFIFFNDSENYEITKKNLIEFFKEMMENFDLKYRIVMKEINNKEFLLFETYFNKKWLPCIEIFFSEELYTKIFKIKGKSGQGTINLENLFLSI